MKNMKKQIVIVAFLLSGGLYLVDCLAATEGAVAINFHGTLVQPACIVNANNPISVEFGDVTITSVDGVTHKRMPLTYSIDCPGGNTIKLQVAGTAAGFDTTALATSISGLGIRLQKDTVTQPINSWLFFTSSSRPALWVVPLKDGVTLLSAGEFTATASLKVDYQ